VSAFATGLQSVRPDWWVAAWLGILFAAVWVFGVLGGASIYIAGFLFGFVPRVPSVRFAVFAIVSALVFYLAMNWAFVEALGVRFYEGLFG
jgi:hypothetical protein